MTGRSWFETEAEDCLARLTVQAQADAAAFDVMEVHRAARCLAGAARLVGEQEIRNAAATVAAGTSMTAVGSVAAGDLQPRLVATLDDLRALVRRGPDATPEVNLAAVSERWQTAPVALPSDSPAKPAVADFIDWTAREVAGFVDTLDDRIESLQADPNDREALATILHRLRGLLGAARIADVTIVGEALRAVDDLTQLMVQLDVPVKMEWLDVFRSARDVLRPAVASLAQGQDPTGVPALSRLRTLHEELVDRYGSPDVTPPPPQDGAGAPGKAGAVSGASPALTQSEFGASRSDRHAEDTWSRAVALRPVIESAIIHDARARAALDLVYSLLRPNPS